ncbi:protein of unknown function [Streptomyces murinus]
MMSTTWPASTRISLPQPVAEEVDAWVQALRGQGPPGERAAQMGRHSPLPEHSAAGPPVRYRYAQLVPGAQARTAGLPRPCSPPARRRPDWHPMAGPLRRDRPTSTNFHLLVAQKTAPDPDYPAVHRITRQKVLPKGQTLDRLRQNGTSTKRSSPATRPSSCGSSASPNRPSCATSASPTRSEP